MCNLVKSTGFQIIQIRIPPTRKRLSVCIFIEFCIDFMITVIFVPFRDIRDLARELGILVKLCLAELPLPAFVHLKMRITKVQRCENLP